MTWKKYGTPLANQLAPPLNEPTLRGCSSASLAQQPQPCQLQIAATLQGPKQLLLLHSMCNSGEKAHIKKSDGH